MYETSGVSVTWSLCFESLIKKPYSCLDRRLVGDASDGRWAKRPAVCLSVSRMRLQRLLKLWIVNRDKRTLLQLPRKCRDPQPAHRNRRHQVHPTQMKILAIERRLDQ